MSMKSKKMESADAVQQREAMMQNMRAVKLQQLARAFLVRRRVRHLKVLEDKVLVKPKPASIAFKQLLPPPVEVPASRPSSGASDSRRQGSKTSYPQTSFPQTAGEASETKKVQPPLSVQVLAGHLQKTGCYSKRNVHSIGQARALQAAQAIFQLLMVPFDGCLQKGHFDRIYRHHRIHQRIASSSTILRLVMMRHGDSSWAFTGGDRPFTSPALPVSPMANHSRTLQPSGWTQVTRTAWALRLCPDWKPHLVLSSSLRCCRQTTDRVCSVLDDPDLRSGSIPRVVEAPIGACKTLDYPDIQGLGFPVWDLGEEVGNAVQQAEADSGGVGGVPKGMEKNGRPPLILMLVTSGAAIETLLGFLATGLSRQHLDQLLIGGGDALLLESPILHRVCEAEFGETLRSDAELWQAALARNRWKVVRHIRGDGLGAKLGAIPKTVQELNVDVRTKIDRKVKRPKFYDTFHVPDAEHEGRNVYSETRERFRSYAGQPMIFSHTEFSKLCRQAGREELPLESEFCVKLKPLVYGFKFNPDPVNDHVSDHT